MTWEKIKEFCKEHKTELIIVGFGIVCIGVCTALGVRYRKNCVVDSRLIRQVAKNTKAIPNSKLVDAALQNKRAAYTQPFDVSSHIRTLPNGWNASAEKQAAAKAMGYVLEPGQTFVNGYVKGKIAA